MKKTILVTGGAGFIGSNFVHHLMAHYPDYRIVVVDTLTYAGSLNNLPEPFRNNDNPDYRFWYGNVCNAELIHVLVSEADYVVHFAAETHVTRSIFDNWLFFQTDVIGTQVVTNAILKFREKVKRFIHISTSEVYGTAIGASMDEEHALNPMSPYASAKCGADRLVYSYWATYQVPAVIIRPFNNFGPRQHLEKVVPRFITSGIMGEPMTVHGEGEAARDFIHVDDVCRAVDMILHAPSDRVEGEVFNLASGGHRSIKEIAQDISRLMDLDEASAVQYCSDRPGQVVRHTGNAEKLKNRLGWEPRLTWEEGLKSTIQWYRDNPDHWREQQWMRTVPIVTAQGKLEYH
ncbi:MAG: GDP-mannose 4,6-dehydratase [Magnetococcales bacterium]|nr:GDP-mannose 4,6-dehydratase [Magnetococcales bacterium]